MLEIGLWKASYLGFLLAISGVVLAPSWPGFLFSIFIDGFGGCFTKGVNLSFVFVVLKQCEGKMDRYDGSRCNNNIADGFKARAGEWLGNDGHEADLASQERDA